MLCYKDKNKLQRCLEDLYCNQCDICICGCGCCKDVATNVCDCCVDPMENLLKQLKNILRPQDTILVTFTDGSEESFMTEQIVSIKDSIINIDGIRFISICNISRVRWRGIDTIDQIDLLPPVCTCGECDCCERPIREELTKQVGSNIELEFLGGTKQVLKVKKVGLGIVIGENLNDGAPDAYSICKILTTTTLLQ